jgi:putative transposase
VTTEVIFLRARVRRLEAEAEIARRLAHLEDQGPPRTRIWRFIERESEHFEVTALCGVCGVSRSAYYAWLKKGEGPRQADLDEAYLTNVIYDIWKKSRRRYGVPRVTAAVAKQGARVNDKRVARIMGQLGIEGISGRRKMKTTRRDPSHVPAADLLEKYQCTGRPCIARTFGVSQPLVAAATANFIAS